MKTELIKAFVTLAKSRSYHDAAEKLFITQSALTKQINRLESTLGLTLFIRGRTGAQLTSSGHYVLKSAQRFLAEETHFLETAKNAALGYEGHLNIGFGLSTLHLAPYLINQFKQRYPSISVSVNDIASAEQEKKLLSGKLSIGFIRIPDNPSLMSIPLIQEQLVLVVNDRTANDADASTILNRAHVLILSDVRGSNLHKQISRYLEEHYPHVQITQESDDILTLLSLISADIGVSILPKSCVFIGVKNIRIVPLPEPQVSWKTGIVWNPAEQDPVRDLFIALCEASLPALQKTLMG